MDDLTMTRLCAEAMELAVTLGRSTLGKEWWYYPGGCFDYDPLKNDTQAMALETWLISRGSRIVFAPRYCQITTTDFDTVIYELIADMAKAENRRRAVCECIARLHQSKEPRK